MKNKIVFLFCIIACLNLSLSAQEHIRLWDEDGVARGAERSELIAFIPENPDPAGISVIICPGGSYIYLAMKKEGYDVAKYLNSKGITAFVLRYRTAWHNNHHPAMIEDIQRAIQIVKENGDEYGIDREKVGVMGFSAGGHLAGLSAIYFDASTKPYFVAMIYPVVSMVNEEIVHKKSRKNLLSKNFSPEIAYIMSLEKNIHADMPPVFLLHCKGDKTVDYQNSVALSCALEEKNVNNKFLLLEESKHGGHGFGIKPCGKASGWIDIFYEWLFQWETNMIMS